MNLFDLGFLILIVLFAIIGVLRGFFKTLASFCGWFVAFVLAIVLAKVVAGWICNWGFIKGLFFDSGEGFSFYNKIYGAMPEELKNISRTQLADAVAGAQNPTDAIIKTISDKSFLLGFLASLFKGSLIEPLADPQVLSFSFDNLAQGFSILISGSILVIFSGIFLFILLRIVTFVLQLVLKSIKLPAIIDRPLGGLMGVARAVGYTVVLLMAFGFMLNFSFMQNVRVELYGDETHRPAVIKPLADWTMNITDKLMKYDDTSKIFVAAGCASSADPEGSDSDEDAEAISTAAFSGWRATLSTNISQKKHLFASDMLDKHEFVVYNSLP